MTVRPDDWVLVTGSGHCELTGVVTAEPTTDEYLYVRVCSAHGGGHCSSCGSTMWSKLHTVITDCARTCSQVRRRYFVPPSRRTRPVLADLPTGDPITVGVGSGDATDRGALLEAVSSRELASSTSLATLPR